MLRTPVTSDITATAGNAQRVNWLKDADGNLLDVEDAFDELNRLAVENRQLHGILEIAGNVAFSEIDKGEKS